MSAPQGRGGGPIGMSGGPPRGGPKAGSNMAGRGGGTWQGGPNWQGGNWRHARRHHRGPFFGYGFAAPYFYDYAAPWMMAAGWSASCAERTAASGFAIDPIRVNDVDRPAGLALLNRV